MLKTRHIMALGGVSALLFAFAPAAMAVDVNGNVVGGTLSQSVSVPGLGGSATGSPGPWTATLQQSGNTSATYSPNIAISAEEGTGASWTDTVTSTQYVGSGTASGFSFGGSGDSSLATAPVTETSTLSGLTLVAAAGTDSFVGTAGTDSGTVAV